MKTFLAGGALLLCMAFPVAGEETGPDSERAYLGNGWLLVNDHLGDGEDRWRSSSLSVSIVHGYDWNGALPTRFGDVLEYRLQAETIQPENIVTPAPGDRPYASALSFGLHGHASLGGGREISAGGDLVVVGPQTGLHHVQNWFHEVMDMPPASAATLNNQIGDKLRLSATVELAQIVEFGGQSSLRPFAELRAGIENYARIGFDFTFGPAAFGDLMVRDTVTGHRYRAVRGASEGLSLVVGADTAKVWKSTFLPEERGYTLSDARNRVRAGFNWQGKNWSVFYGLTWLGEEFVGQNGDQLTGAFRIDAKF